jgi:6,7-dimethyl-8-ribityllumazine synthase
MAVSSIEQFNITGIFIPKDACIVTVRTSWNAAIVNKLLAGIDNILSANNVQHIVLEVPGAVEIGYAIKKYNSTAGIRPPHAFIALGCVLKGDTPHFEYVCRSVTDAVTQLNLMLDVPVIFGVLTLENQEQADERTGGKHGNKGEEAAVTALKMIAFSELIKNQR